MDTMPERGLETNGTALAPEWRTVAFCLKNE